MELTPEQRLLLFDILDCERYAADEAVIEGEDGDARAYWDQVLALIATIFTDEEREAGAILNWANRHHGPSLAIFGITKPPQED